MLGGSIRISVASAALCVAGSCAHAAPLCRDPVTSGTGPQFQSRAAAPIVILDWHQTVCLEHSDRVRRLKQLAASLPEGQRPSFSEYVIPRERLPAAFPSGMPVLRVVFPEQSFFDTASSRVRPDAMAALQMIAASLRGEVPDVAVFVAGHTDSRGGEDYNYNLSVDRADAVAQRLRTLGIGDVALWRMGFGEAVPLQPNDTIAGMAVNRRVEFLFGPRA